MTHQGLPSRADYLAAYCARTGRDGIEGWNFYLAFSLFRLASIVQGVYRRMLSGTVASDVPVSNDAPAMAIHALGPADLALNGGSPRSGGGVGRVGERSGELEADGLRGRRRSPRPRQVLSHMCRFFFSI